MLENSNNIDWIATKLGNVCLCLPLYISFGLLLMMIICIWFLPQSSDPRSLLYASSLHVHTIIATVHGFDARRAHCLCLTHHCYVV